MPRCSVTRRVNFNAAHRLHNPAMPEAWNRETFGPCNNPSFHGHNYDLDVSVEGEISPATGYVMDLTELKRLVEDRVLCRLDHQNLNVDVPWFAELNPTAEKHRRRDLARAARGAAVRPDPAHPTLGDPPQLCRLFRRRLTCSPSRTTCAR
jgi:6-pyruvoyltetrahydropterin/6-carboxytetrahydropterin synthase